MTPNRLVVPQDTHDHHPLLPRSLQDHYRDRGYWEGRVLYEFVRDWADATPDRLAVTGPEPMTYRELWTRAHSVAALLRSAGLRTGDALLAPLQAGWRGMVLQVATSLCGLLFVPRSHRIAPQLALNLARQLDVRGLVIGAATAQQDDWAAAVPAMGLDPQRLFTTGGAVEGFVDLDPHLDDDVVVEPVPPRPLAPTIVLSSGGSTGTPKSILHASEALVFAARNFAGATGYGASDVHVAIAPYGHAGGSVFEIYMPLIHGAAVLPVPAWRPAEVAEAVQEWKGTFFLSMGTHIYDLLQLGPDGAAKLRSMRLAATGAGSDRLFLDGEQRLGFTLLRMYGFSEAPGHALGRLGEAADTRLIRDGVPFEGMEVRVAGGPSTDPRFEVAGPYRCRGPNLFLGYGGRPDLTAEAVDAEGFYSPGDLIGQDADGYLTWLGRTKDIIRRGGLQIDPLELENVLSGHPSIAAVVVVGLPDERLGERAAVIAIAERDGDRGGKQDGGHPDLQDLCSFLIAAGIGRQSLPEHLFWVDALARTELGKLDRATIREQVLEGSR